MSNEIQRETKTITTVGGHAVKVYTYITGREARQIQEIFTKQMELKMKDGGKPEVAGMKGTIMEEMENKAIEFIVVSVDEKTENTLDTLLDLPNEDYKEVKNYIDELTGGKKKEKSPEQKQTT